MGVRVKDFLRVRQECYGDWCSMLNGFCLKVLGLKICVGRDDLNRIVKSIFVQEFVVCGHLPCTFQSAMCTCV